MENKQQTDLGGWSSPLRRCSERLKGSQQGIISPVTPEKKCKRKGENIDKDNVVLCARALTTLENPCPRRSKRHKADVQSDETNKSKGKGIKRPRSRSKMMQHFDNAEVGVLTKEQAKRMFHPRTAIEVNPQLPRSDVVPVAKCYVRECYDSYYNEILYYLNENWTLINVTGPPGIGKSMFYDYFFQRLTKTELMYQEKTIVLVSFSKTNALKRCVLYRNKQYKAWLDDKDDYVFPRGIENALFLIDGPPSVAIEAPRSQMIVFTSPNYGWFDKIHKSYHIKLYMPIWTLEQLQEAWKVLFGNFTGVTELLQERYNYFGGVARLLFDSE